MDKDLYDLPPEELANVPQVPGSLEQALDALEADNDFLRVGGVFTDDLLETWVTLQAHPRGRRPPPPPPPLRVHPLLRHLTRRPNRQPPCWVGRGHGPVRLTLSSEEHGHRGGLVANAARWRGPGSTSSPSPTTSTRGSGAQGHSPFVWSVLGASRGHR